MLMTPAEFKKFTEVEMRRKVIREAKISCKECIAVRQLTVAK